MASFETLVRQASMTTDEYLREAKERIDAIFGDGYASQHPELVGSFIRASAMDIQTMVMSSAADKISDALNRIADSKM